MRNVFIALLMLAATVCCGSFGNYPLSNGSFIAVSDFQVLHSAIVERCWAAGVSEPALSLPVNVYTGMYVSGVVTGEIVSGVVTSKYYTTNYVIGSVNVTMTNWSGVYSNQAVTWSGPMTAADMAEWDTKIIDLIPRYCDPWTNQELYLKTILSVTTDELTGVVSTNYPSSPLMLTQSNMWKNANIGVDMFYSTGSAPTQQFHNYRFMSHPTQSFEFVLASFACLVTNTFYTTNVSDGVTSVVRNVDLSFGRIGAQNRPASYGALPVFDVYGSHMGIIGYKECTNADIFIRVISANTNAEPDVSNVKLFIKGLACSQTSTSAPRAISSVSYIDGVRDGERLSNSFYYVAGDSYYDPFIKPGSSSVWHRAETNGQYDTMIGTIIEIVWSNRMALYGPPDGHISASALNERWMVLTNLTKTWKPSYYYGLKDFYGGAGTICDSYTNANVCDGGILTWPNPSSILTNSVETNLDWNPILTYSFSAYANGYSESCGGTASDVIRFSKENIVFKSYGSPFVLSGSTQTVLKSMLSFWNVYTMSGTYAMDGNPWYTLFDTKNSVTSCVIGIITAYVGNAVSPSSAGWFAHFNDWIYANATNAQMDGQPCEWSSNKKYSDAEENPCYPNPVSPMIDLGYLGCGEAWKGWSALTEYVGGGRYDSNESVPCSAFSVLTWDFVYQ